MPEGHTIHRLAGQHQRWFGGQRLHVSSPQGRFTGADHIDGQVLESTDAWGKHLFHHWSGGGIVHVHLGLFGRFRSRRPPIPEPRPTVRMRLLSPDRALDLTGPTACALISAADKQAITDRLGPDPLRDDADPDRAWQALQRRRIGIGQAIMDQRVVAGVGNVYRAEVLLAHGLHPAIPAREIDAATWRAMWITLQRWMRAGVRSGRIVTTDLPGNSPRRRTACAERVNVYGQRACGLCHGPVRDWQLAGRRAWVCERCQPAPGHWQKPWTGEEESISESSGSAPHQSGAERGHQHE